MARLKMVKAISMGAVISLCTILAFSDLLSSKVYSVRSLEKIGPHNHPSLLVGGKQEKEFSQIFTVLHSDRLSNNRQEIDTTEAGQSLEHQKYTPAIADFIPGAPPNLPWPKRQLNVTPETLMNLPWVKELWVFLNTRVDTSQPVVITASNYPFCSLLLNWLVHALLRQGDKPVKNIIVLSMDKEMYTFLRSHDIFSLLTTQEDLSRVNDSELRPNLTRVEITRLIAMRLINHWGYDVVNYDSDAFILKNPQELFDQHPHSHVIGSRGVYPFDISAKWGFAFCMGVVLMRASPETEVIWEAMSMNPDQVDQKMFNQALETLNVTFYSQENSSDMVSQQGEAPLTINNHSTSLRVTSLPMKDICRGIACTKDILPECYVWHQGGRHHTHIVINSSKQAKLWLVREDWSEVSANSTQSGNEWLMQIMT